MGPPFYVVIRASWSSRLQGKGSNFILSYFEALSIGPAPGIKRVSLSSWALSPWCTLFRVQADSSFLKTKCVYVITDVILYVQELKALVDLQYRAVLLQDVSHLQNYHCILHLVLRYPLQHHQRLFCSFYRLFLPKVKHFKNAKTLCSFLE